MKRLIFAMVFVGLASFASAQVVGPTAIEFTSTDHTALIPAGQTGAGGPLLTSYTVYLLNAASDPVTGPVLYNTSVPKVNVTLVTGTTYHLNFTAVPGLAVPACTVQPCTQYKFVLTSTGPAGSTPRSVASTSPSFTSTPPVVTGPRLPAAPVSVLTK